ncbi:FtsX-like permease family protein [Micromonospora mangrovi]|uniref:FtsX-like permease family protein n=2 Tax=Micromonospora TaxID=1873 RepID=A0AAU8H8V8_9ACTN
MSRDRLAGTVGSWRTALRIARREARRARGRTALVLAMITLPVLALTFIAVTYDMSELSRAERMDRRLGGADVELRWVAENAIVQGSWGEDWWGERTEAVPRSRPPTAAEVAGLLPAGSRSTPVRWWVPFETRVGGRLVSFEGRSLDLTDPLTRPLARFRAGRAPAAPDDVAVSPQALRHLGVRLGGTVTTSDGARTYTVVGVVEFADNLGDVVVLPPGVPLGPNPAEGSWLVDLPGPLDEALVDRLNARGVAVAARTPVPGRDASDARTSALPDPETAGNALLVGGLGLLEVVLLVGPAFAVGVRRRRRDLALVAVAGGDHVHLRRVVLADGVVLGAGGAALGLLLGTAAAFAGRPLVEQYLTHARFGAYRVFPAALAAIAAVAVLAGVLAALAPALAAARQDVVAGLAGRRDAPRHRRRWLVIGVLLALGGSLTAAVGASRSNPTTVLAGLVLGELGLVFVTPTLIGLLARTGRLLPLAPRLALREASRNRSSAAPAISAVMAAVAGSVAVGVYLASDDARTRTDWQPGIPPGNVLLVPGDAVPPALPALPAVVERARAVLPAASVVAVAQPACAHPVSQDDYCSVSAVLPPELTCPYETTEFRSAAGRRRALADPRCVRPTRIPDGIYVPAVVDGDGATLPVLTGAPAGEVAAASAVLRAGGVVVTDPRYLVDGRVTVTASGPTDGPATPPTATATLPGYVLHGGVPVDRLLLSPAAAARVGLVGRPLGYAIDTTGPPTVAQQERLAADLRPVAELVVQVEQDSSGPDRRPLLLLLAVGAGVITLGAAGAATGLAAAEARRDLSTLAAVGASPRVRRILSLCQAGVIAVLGSVLGLVAGTGSAVIILTSVNRRLAESWPVQSPYPVVVPWSTLGVLVVVPLLAMLGAALFTRSRLPVERRLD